MSDPRPRFLIVGVGASAGGVEALKLFFRGMPDAPGMAFVIVTHLSHGHKSSLEEIVQRFTSLPVQPAVHGTILSADAVYVMPEPLFLRIRRGRLEADDTPAAELGAKPIDFFFCSLAEDQGEYAAAIVLSGLDGDGSLGVKAIKERDGLTLAQTSDKSAPKFDSMPQSAIATGLVDLALPAEEMAGRLVEFARGMGALSDMSLDSGVPRAREILKSKEAIAAIIQGQLGHDFSGYKDETFARRVRRRSIFLNLQEVPDYLARLRADPTEVTALFRDLLISVTDFFRDADAFETLANEVVPAIMEGRSIKSTIRVWVPGCATGEEVFSIAILLREALDGVESPPKIQIFATDIDERALEVARAGRYPEPLLRSVSAERLKRFFVKEESAYVVSREIRELCIFSPHSVFRDPPFSRVDLISCRNLLIYLGADMQQQVLPIFHYSLRASGYLFLGLSENVSRHADLFEPVDRKNRIFRACGSLQPMPSLPFALDKKPGYPAFTAKRPGLATLRRDAEAQLLERHVPQYVVVSSIGDVVYFSADTGRYLQPAVGAPSRQLVDLARKGLRLEIRSALRSAFETGRPVRRENLSIDAGGDRVQLFTLEIEPFESSISDQALLLVTFQDVGPEQPRGAIVVRSSSVDKEEALLDKELKDTRDKLQGTIEEYETALEELRSSNEELLSLNEEHQSANEELEASREEMQSLNEELQTVNSELKLNISELDAANDDLRHFFESTQTATVLLDSRLRISNFTPAAAELFRIQTSDRGRPLADLSMRLVFPGFEAVLKTILKGEATHQEDVPGKDGSSHYRVVIRPYDKLRGDEAGLVVTVTDITDLARATAALSARPGTPTKALAGARNAKPKTKPEV